MCARRRETCLVSSSLSAFLCFLFCQSYFILALASLCSFLSSLFFSLSNFSLRLSVFLDQSYSDLLVKCLAVCSLTCAALRKKEEGTAVFAPHLVQPICSLAPSQRVTASFPAAKTAAFIFSTWRRHSLLCLFSALAGPRALSSPTTACSS